jgi:acetyl-CoA carboxylase alpha subunit
MAMFRRLRKPAPPLRRKQQEIAQQEAQLREKVESLQRVVMQSRTPAQKKSPARKPDRSATNNVVEKRFHVSIAMEAPQLLDADRRSRRPRAMRKERRQGRIAFLILLVALGFVVMLLISHLHP